MSKLKIVYIYSLGHSGSTLLDVILNQHSDIQSVGEIIFFDRSWYSRSLIQPTMGYCNRKQYEYYGETAKAGGSYGEGE